MNCFQEVHNPNCNIKIGGRVRLGSNVVLGPNCKNIDIGFGCYLGRDIYIDLEELVIKDYTTIHHGSVVYGKKTYIGYNCWFGHYTIIDSLGGSTRIGNNVGVGAHSQLWSHMQFGDVLAGCRWCSGGNIVLEDDVWLVGHSIIGPIHAEEKSMLLTGSMALKNMKKNNIYAGNPAQNITGRLGTQFSEISLDEKLVKFEMIKKQFYDETGINTVQFKAVDSFYTTKSKTLFNLMERTYQPRYTRDEYMFMRFMLYEKAKFIPVLEM